MQLIASKLFVLLSLIWLCHTSTANNSIRIATGEYPPFSSEHLPHQGVGLRIIREAFALQGISVEYGFFPWKRAYHYATTGAWAASAMWSRSEQRQQQVLFSEPLYNSTFVFFHLKSLDFNWHNLASLEGISIGATSGYTYTPEFYQAIEQGRLQVQFVHSDRINLAKLLAERIQIFPLNVDVGYYLLRQEFGDESVARISHHPLPTFSSPAHLVFAKSQRGQALLIQFNKGLAQLKASGKLADYLGKALRQDFIAQGNTNR